MKQAARAVVVGIFCSLTLAVAGCGPSQSASGDDDDGGGGDDPGPGPGPSTTPVASCAANCATDLGAARTALVAGDYQQAFELYKCADTPEAAFGAGLTRTLLALDGANADSVLADLGEPPLPMTDIFGLDGVLARGAARWNGQGSLTLSGGLAATLPFDQAMYEVSDDILYSIGTIYGQDETSPAHADLSLSFAAGTDGTPFAAGAVLAITASCTSTFPTVTIDPRLEYLYLSFDVGGTSYSCDFPYSIPVGSCEPDGGSIVVTSAATAPGQPASYQFNNVLLGCYPSSDIDDVAADVFVRVNGSVSATAVGVGVDTTGLHPIFGSGDSIAAHIPAGKSLNDLVRHSGAVGAELEEAACFFKLAGQGTGHVYDVPGALFAGPDVPFSKGDTEIVAGLALLGAAAGHLAHVHEIDMPLGLVICDSADPAATPCLDDAAFVSRFNQAFSSRFHAGRLLVVERLVAEALPLLDQGIADLDGTSLMVRNAETSPGLDALRTLLQASLQSIQTGSVALPHVTPALNVNFKALFENPRNPHDLGPLLAYEEECELDDCYGSTGITTTFLERYFAGRIDADWEGSYEWTDGDAISSAFEEVGNSATRYSSFGD